MRRAPQDTPLMRQYLDVKDRYPDGIVFFRLGDFYEMFFEDALVAAKALDLTLTTRDKGRDDAVPMCGVPHHAARGYISRLCELGHKVVICEQVEDPRTAKGIVKREVTRVVTPGIVLDEDMLDARADRWLAAICGRGLAFLDVTTGEFHATQVDGDPALLAELARVDPREILHDDTLADDGPVRRVRAAWTRVEPEADGALLAELLEEVPSGIPDSAARAAAALLRYARATQPGGVLPVRRLVVYDPRETLVLDEASRTNLEITETIVGRSKRGSLFGVLDECKTSPGARLLRRWLLFPLTRVSLIRRRQDAVECLVERATLRAELRARLAEIHDLERLAGRVTLGAATPRDVYALRRSLERLPGVAELLRAELAQALAPPELLALPDRDLGDLAGMAAEIAAALAEDPPPTAKEGGFIRRGHSAEVDELRRLSDGGKDQILAIEVRERERTGIVSLKVRYNRVFGYYLEITRSNLKNVPADYIRKQTLANAERYVTPELADLEAKVLGAEDKLVALEAELFETLRKRVAERAAAIQRAAEWIAVVDTCASLAEVAHTSGYCRPLVDDSQTIDVEEGRHPVVEKLAAGAMNGGAFVPNDCKLDPTAEQILILTGPNMAGKSTFMRQVAHISLLAQIGSFVPARRARVGVVDRIFTRVGAADNLARGESTFMVEMRETAHILQHATRSSLVVLDEIGRGTSTYDGVSIAWAVAEYLHQAIGAKTLFATHYHELTALSQELPRVRNVSVAVREHRGDVVFLRKVVPGPASRSYGIEVARLAGLPRSVIARSRQILADLERPRPSGPDGDAAPTQLSLLGSTSPPVKSVLDQALCDLDPDRMTPLQALQALADLKLLSGGNATIRSGGK